LNRVLAVNIYAEINVPPFDRAAMDGYAVKAQDTFNAGEANPVKLKVIGRIFAGEKLRVEVSNRTAVEVATGASIPIGANAVVPIEYTNIKGEIVEVYKSVRPYENISKAGSDISAGELALSKGIQLSPREIGVLAALGFKEIPCYIKPKVYIASTGGELKSPGEPLEHSKIYDINSYTLASATAMCGCQPILLGIVKDDFKSIKETILRGVKNGDIIVFSGGVSAGAGDLLYRVVEQLENHEVLFHGVSMKPGKPTMAALVQGKPLFSLPGYPVSALMVFQSLFEPVLRLMAGLTPRVKSSTVKAKAGVRMFTAQGRQTFLPVHLVNLKEGYVAFPTPGDSGSISTLAYSDGFVEISANKAFVREGETVEVTLFTDRLKLPNLVFVGSKCSGVNLLAEILRTKHPNINFKIIGLSSRGGLAALKRREADLAGICLLDEKTGKYNVPFLELYRLKGEVSLFRGYLRRWGLIVAKGNPKKVREPEDILKRNLKFINLGKNFEARTLLDLKFKRLAEKSGLSLEELTGKVNSYQVEAMSKLAVASAIAEGKADVGFGDEASARKFNLDFIPLGEEEYDFAVRNDRINRFEVQAFLSTLSSEEFAESLKVKVKGLTPRPDMGEKIVY
jgi:putative molybdopterin biosynthesis protein